MKTRFCPSPTGMIHLGNLRTALFNALLARSDSGCFLLRIEDTDRERSKDEYTAALMQDLRWLSLDWQEGVDGGGDLGPYAQSERQAIYDKYYDVLIEKDLAYPCFCSEDDLKLERKLQLAANRPPRYSRKCCKLSAEQIAQKRADNTPETLRYKVPAGVEIKFTDLVHGDQVFKSDDIGDFVIRRGNKTAPFMYCNAIDDALMQVSHALRGEDHLSNTPRQLLMLEALGLAAPTYGHINLIVGSDGSPLSKRHGSTSVADLRANGYLPIAILNYLARLGHHYTENEAKLMSLDELSANFSSDHFSKSPAQFNLPQLQHWQQLAVAALSLDEFKVWAATQLEAVPDGKINDFVAAVQPNVTFPQDVTHWVDVIFAEINLSDDLLADCKLTGIEFFQTLREQIIGGSDLKTILDTLKQEHSVKGKALFMPLRVALTGMTHGPELAPIFALMPRAVQEARITSLLNALEE